MFHGKNSQLVLDVMRQVGGPQPSLATLYDESRFHNNGTFVNHTNWVQLPTGAWVNTFDGDDSILLGQPTSLNLGVDSFTIEAWVNPVAIGGTDNVIVGRQINAGNFLRFFHRGGGSLSLHCQVGAVDQINILFGCLKAGIYQYVVFTRQGINSELFRNGISVATSAAGTGGNINIAANWYIGTDGINFWIGKIGRVRIKKRVLSLGEIRNNFESERRYFPDVQ